MMNRFFTLLLAVSCLTAVGQVPDYVPSDGLVAYFPFDGNVLNLVSDEDGLPMEVGFGADRFGQPSGALAVVGGQTEVSLPLSSFAEGGDPRTMSYWLKRADNATEGEPFTGVVYNGQSCGQKSFGCGANFSAKGVSVDFSCGAVTFEHAASHQECGWNHIVVVVPDIPNPRLQDVVVYENGSVLEFLTGVNLSNQIATIHGSYTIGGSFFSWGDRLFDAADLSCSVPLIDDLAFFNRALSPDEVDQLYVGDTVLGCTDEGACNFNDEANFDDGTCYNCDIPASHCGVGTVWDAETQTCIVANPADTNLDGCVQLNDLLDVLSAYGDCRAEEAPWACGDPLEYQGYDYATVQIGEQCWFAENLRAENDRDGGAIESIVDDGEWTSTSSGAWCSPGPDHGVAFGLLYNGHAVLMETGLCPSGWGVPTKEEWQSLSALAGGEAVAGLSLKSSSGWPIDSNGNDALGFTGLPAGTRNHDTGLFAEVGTHAYFHSSTSSGSEQAWRQKLFPDANNLGGSNRNLNHGFSVRCLKNAD